MSTITLDELSYVGDGYLNPGITQWTERSAGVVAGFSTLRASVKVDTKVRPKWDLHVPVVATTDSSCACTGAVLRVGDVTISVRMDLGMTVAERTSLADRIADLVQSAQFRASVIDTNLPT